MSEITWNRAPVKYAPRYVDDAARQIPITDVVDAIIAGEYASWRADQPFVGEIKDHLRGGHTLTEKIARKWCDLGDDKLRDIGKSAAVLKVVQPPRELSLDLVALVVVLVRVKSWSEPQSKPRSKQ